MAQDTKAIEGNRVVSGRKAIDFAAQMVSYKILSEVERICDKRGINNKELAKKVGTSPSYITQLFRGTKRVNMEFIAKLQLALDIEFHIKARRKLPDFVAEEFRGLFELAPA